MSRALDLLRRETALAWGRGGGPLVSAGFYAGVATLLPLAVGPEPARLAAVAPGAAWTALALSTLLGLDRLFERDYEDGALDLLSLSPLPLEIACAIKCLCQ
ncbi:MAG TPA: heme exporter protein CcmB, partial [Phenylobacterium sp.]|nr:heme exporter protein CcmB [Phenylobacterium sp.]